MKGYIFLSGKADKIVRKDSSKDTFYFLFWDVFSD